MRLWLAIAAMLLGSYTPTNFGIVQGVVLDEAGAVLPGATITVTDESRGLTRVVVSDSSGVFIVPALRPGLYSVTVEITGFGAFRAEGVEVASGNTTHMPVTLKIAGVEETVTVTGEYGPGRWVFEARQGKRVSPVRSSSPAIAAYDPLAGLRPARSGFHTEDYDKLTDNPFRRVEDEPLSTFSIDVDTASYANVRRFLRGYQLPPKDAVRIEELLNYFDYDYPQPPRGEPFSVTFEQMDCPWKPEHRLVRIGLKGWEPEPEARPPGNLVFLIDVSGSMADANKLPLVVASMKMLAGRLKPVDRVSIVVYAGASGVVLTPTSGSEIGAILSALDLLQAGGSTNGGEGIELAYRLAAEAFIEGGVNRVVLATDGDFNVGVTSQGELVRLIEEKAKSGIFLTVLGFGMGNYKDGNLEQLAGKGNGNYAYIDTLREARKVLVDELQSTLVTIAKDVKIQVELNPARVAGYRLIGYENRMLDKEDFNDDTKDAGEIGAGHTVTALYELVPRGVPIEVGSVDPLKYQEASQPRSEASRELLTVKLRYKEPEGSTSRLLSFALEEEKGEASDDMLFAAAVASFGMLLRESPYRGNAGWKEVSELARSALGADERAYRREFLELVETAELVAHKTR